MTPQFHDLCSNGVKETPKIPAPGFCSISSARDYMDTRKEEGGKALFSWQNQDGDLNLMDKLSVAVGKSLWS